MAITAKATTAIRTICGYDVLVDIDFEDTCLHLHMSSTAPYRDHAVFQVGRKIQAVGIGLSETFDQTL